MKLKVLKDALSVCKVASVADIDLDAGFFFIGKTGEETSLVCRTEDAPIHALARDDGWRGLRVEGPLDFSLVGILAGISGALAEAAIPLFAVSTYDTDYVLVKAEHLTRAVAALNAAGYGVG